MPGTSVDRFEEGSVFYEEWSLRVTEPQSLPVLDCPFLFVDNLYFIDGQLPELAGSPHRNRQPGPTVASANLIAIGKAVFFKLDMIEHDMHIRCRNAVKVAQPRQICRLINGNDHILAAL